jgi:HK97 family phage major capsid protein
MDPELKKLLDEQATTFANFKIENDKRLKEVEKGGTESATTVANVEKLNGQLTALNAQLVAFTAASADRADKLETKLNRASLGGAGGGDDKDAIVARNFATQRNQKPEAYTADDARKYRNALDTYFRRGSSTPPEVLNVLAIGSDPDGGYWVLPDTSGRIVQKVYVTSPMRQYADVQAIGSDALEGMYDNDQASSGWTAEKGTRTETTTPQVGKWRIPAWEQYAEPKCTQQFLDDANVNVDAWLEGKVADKLARVENTAFVSGNGSGQPRGFLDHAKATTADATRAWGTVQYIPSGVSAAFASTNPADPILDMIYALRAPYRAGSVFMAQSTVLAAVRKLKDGQGNYLAGTKFDQGAFIETIFGFPAAMMEDMPVIAANSYSLAFGNWKAGYQIVDRNGIRILRDPFTQKGFVLFFTTKRTGGDLINSEAIKLMKFATS